MKGLQEDKLDMPMHFLKLRPDLVEKGILTLTVIKLIVMLGYISWPCYDNNVTSILGKL